MKTRLLGAFLVSLYYDLFHHFQIVLLLGQHEYLRKVKVSESFYGILRFIGLLTTYLAYQQQEQEEKYYCRWWCWWCGGVVVWWCGGGGDSAVYIGAYSNHMKRCDEDYTTSLSYRVLGGSRLRGRHFENIACASDCVLRDGGRSFFPPPFLLCRRFDLFCWQKHTHEHHDCFVFC
uniref:Uncharacterized protein n=1 Tax=Glossina palpalis gambiensis TaxID=67801 RepID=A0A1B0B505_9MUSC